MELKEIILSTLAELDEEVETKEKEVTAESLKEEESTPAHEVVEESSIEMNSEAQFLSNVRERVLVLFEGFQSPNNKNIEAKVDLTLNFLEYLLATIEERLEVLEKTRES